MGHPYESILMKLRTAIIIGAGPAGLTAAYELLDKTDVKPVVLEATGDTGGVSRTACYKGNRIDVGGHRFFTKSDRVLRWWCSILPLQGQPARDDLAVGRDVPVSRQPGTPDPERTDKILLVRERTSRILFRRRLFDYPLTPNLRTLSGLGCARTARILSSYIGSQLSPRKPEKTLEDFLVNRFGRELYATFFRDYTEKVWGVPCHQIAAEWGVQRIKGLSIRRVVADAATHALGRGRSLRQQNTETSLIRWFLYPKLGPGQMWAEVARTVENQGGEIRLGYRAIGLPSQSRKITGVVAREEATGRTTEFQGDFFFSSMPVKDLVAAMGPSVPNPVRQVAEGLVYRDFMTVGLLLRRLRVPGPAATGNGHGLIPDCWLYIQEPDVRMGRLQVFNNWSPYLVADPRNVWVGLEYFCTEGDDLWRMPDREMLEFAVREMCRLGFIEAQDVLDGTVLRTPKAYPAYFGTYDRFDTIREFTNNFRNLYLIGRNGMHRYNNQDHSMLTAMTAVENIVNNQEGKDNIWAVNTEEAYHEAK
jgi:protoporphyrinogen oxidase